MPPLNLTEVEGGVQFSVKVQPRSSKNELCGLQGEALKIRLTAPPVEGEANAACIRFLADQLGVPKSRISIIAGHSNPHKIIRVEGLDREAVLALLPSVD